MNDKEHIVESQAAYVKGDLTITRKDGTSVTVPIMGAVQLPATEEKQDGSDASDSRS